METDHIDTKPLGLFISKIAQKHYRVEVVSNWHRLAYREAGIELPHSVDLTDCYIEVLERDKEGRKIKDKDDNSVLDIEATKASLHKIVNLARSFGYKVDEDYFGTSLYVGITLKDGESYGDKIKVSYVASRELSCTKKVVGTKVIPAIPERIEDVFEWDCPSVGFTADDNVKERK